MQNGNFFLAHYHPRVLVERVQGRLDFRPAPTGAQIGQRTVDGCGQRRDDAEQGQEDPSTTVDASANQSETVLKSREIFISDSSIISLG